MKGTLWLAWRQQRALIVCGAAVLLAAAALAAYSRAGMVDDLRSGLFDGCDPGPLYCTRAPDGLPRFLDVEPLRLLGALNIALPALVGMFWGAPLLGRDRELGTHRMVLTQGVGRAQWFASRFALAALGTVMLSGALALLFRWWWEPAANRSYGLFWYEATALTGSGPSWSPPRCSGWRWAPSPVCSRAGCWPRWPGRCWSPAWWRWRCSGRTGPACWFRRTGTSATAGSPRSRWATSGPPGTTA